MTKASPPRAGRLFSDPEKSAPAHSESAHVAEIDGASRGNPGPASYAVILRGPGGRVAHQIAKYIGLQTNNVAEYHALIAALDYAAAHKLSALRVRSDSELLVRQMQGRYKVKSPDLRPLFERARKLAAAIPHFSIEHVRRESNRDADALANAALDGKSPPLSAARHDPGTETRKPKFETRRVRARYARGVLHPAEPLDLPEGTEVQVVLEWRKPEG